MLDRLRSGLLCYVLPVDCCVTSPPYWRQRDYEHPDQLGLEKTPEEYVQRLCDIMDGVRAVMRPEGLAWLNIDDTYVNGGLSLIPQRLSLELRSRGWRQVAEVIWDKPNAMPETAARRRPGHAHEKVLVLSPARKGQFYDWESVVEPAEWARWGKQTSTKYTGGKNGWVPDRSLEELRAMPKTKRRRDVWRVPTPNHRGAHNATFPDDLIEPMILSSCPPGGVVLDPFAGSGTVARVAERHGRLAICIELVDKRD